MPQRANICHFPVVVVGRECVRRATLTGYLQHVGDGLPGPGDGAGVGASVLRRQVVDDQVCAVRGHLTGTHVLG